MNYPTHLQYSKSHEWIHTEDGVAVIGISDFAQHALGDVVFVNLPGEGDEVTAGEAFGDVESVKAVSDLVSPVSGTVCAVNEELLDAPELLNSQCYDAWIIKVEGVTATEELLDADGYEAFEEAGDPFDAGIAQRLHRHIYASGNSVEPGAAYAAFRGRAPRVEALLRKRGLDLD